MIMLRPALALLLLTWTLPALAQQGDPAAGKAKATPCAACHGPDGNSTNPEWPKLAGQHAAYTAAQLRHFKQEELRSNAMMTGMVAGLSEQDMLDLGAYFATQNTSGGFADEALVELGERIFRGGNTETGVPACMSCHGPRGLGDPRAGFPKLAGQHATYTQMQLESFRLGTRSTDPNGMMRDIALRMTPQEMEAVASYINGLH